MSTPRVDDDTKTLLDPKRLNEKGSTTLVARALLERNEEWMTLKDQVPPLSFDPHWVVQLYPPFGGAFIRFEIHRADNPTRKVAVVLDMWHRITGSRQGPNWEIFGTGGCGKTHSSADEDYDETPDGEILQRFDMKDTEGLLRALRQFMDAKPRDVHEIDEQ